jgi:lipopolysaccharide biosynthesis protein
MATLAVLAHYDPDGFVAHHVRHSINVLRPVADRLVFVTTTSLTGNARAALDTVDEVIERPNTGYDFYSWRTGLLSVPDWAEHERVILANDSIVGPLSDPRRILEHQLTIGADVYGLTISPQAIDHVQSYFLVLGAAALRQPAVRRFWQEMAPLDDRQAVIDSYELGFGRLAADAGLSLGSYFTASPHEERVMAARIASCSRPPGLRTAAAAAAYWLQPLRKVTESPILGLWDRVFVDDRLPAVKVSLFSRDPYRIDRAGVLARLTERFPAAFTGFDGYLKRIGVTF